MKFNVKFADMETNKDGNFEFIKDKDDPKRHYILKNDKVTKRGFYILLIILAVLIIATIYFGNQTV